MQNRQVSSNTHLIREKKCTLKVESVNPYALNPLNLTKKC
jgi:hypothetical protein